MNITKTLVVAAIAALATPAATVAGIPNTATQNVPGLVNYQGKLQNPNAGFANYADGIYTLDIRLWSHNTATTASYCLWGGQYKVYVKDGYFNLMLGDSGASELTLTPLPKYKNADLWKALWSCSTTDATRYLGVTPHEGPNGSTLSTFSEILPRQQLLSTPFAFSAQHAHYADYCNSTSFTCLTNLTVNGTTTLKGNVTFNGQVSATGATQTLGPVKTTSAGVNLGNGYTSATAENRTSLPQKIYDVGQYLYFYSYYGMSFAPTAGSATFTIPSGYNMKVTGQGSFVSDTPVNTIGGTGNTTIKGSLVSVAGTSSLSLKGSSTYVQSDGRVFLQPATNEFVFGQGELRWGVRTAPTTNSYKPFRKKTVSITVKAGSMYGTSTSLSDFELSNFSWTVADWHNNTSYTALASLYMNGTNVRLEVNTSPTSDTTFSVTLLGVNKNLITIPE